MRGKSRRLAALAVLAWLGACDAARLAEAPPLIDERHAVAPFDDLLFAFDWVTGRIEQGGRTGVLARWEGPIRFTVRDRIASPSIAASVLPELKRIAAIANVEVVELKDEDPGANFVVAMTSSSMGGTGTGNCAARVAAEASGRLRLVTLEINLASRGGFTGCIRHEILHGLGLGHPHAIPSILSYQFPDLASLTRNDVILLKSLYDPVLRPGFYRLATLDRARNLIARQTGVNEAEVTRRDLGRPVLDRIRREMTEEAEKGGVFAAHQLGNAYFFGHAVAVDHAQGVAWWKRAADAGFSEAAWRVARSYLRGLGVPVDLDAGRRYATEAARRDHQGAQFELAEWLAAESKDPESLGEALVWAILAERGGHPEGARLRGEIARRVPEARRREAEASAAAWRPAPRTAIDAAWRSP